MQHYEKDVRPTHDHRLPTNVTFGFLLNQLVDVVSALCHRLHSRYVFAG